MRLMPRIRIISTMALLLSGLGVLVSQSPETTLAQTNDPVFAGAGDIASCGWTRDESTAQLLDGIPGTVFTLGDNIYSGATITDFNNCYAPGWGRHKDRTRPSPGNHDYDTANASGYYTYFGAIASPLDTNCTSNCKGYYSYNLGAWHIIALNSEIDHAAGSVQEQWLRADLAGNPSMCTLAYWHKPRFSSGDHGNDSSFQPFWQALYDYEADVVLNGHDHTYERFAPQSPTGQADPTRGIREFVVGTGGANLYPFPTIRPNSEVRNNTTWGVIKFTLHATSYDWQFIPIAGQTFTDSGTGNCVGADPGTTATRTPRLTHPIDLPDTGFAPNRITSLPAQPASLAYIALGDIWLEIPALNIKTSIVGIPNSNNTWNVDWLSKDAGWLHGTAFPSWEGNSVLTGHVYDANGLPGPFANLKELKYGDQIVVHLYGEKYIFEIREVRTVQPTSTRYALKHLEDYSYLTLITCLFYDEKTDAYRYRQIVRAVLVKVQAE